MTADILPYAELPIMLEFMTDRSKKNLIVALAYDGLCTFEYGIVAEIFGLDRPEMGPNWYQFETVAVEDGPLRAAGGLTITATGKMVDLQRADTIIIPGWRGKDAKVPDHFCKLLQGAHKRGTRLVSICSGVYVLAAAGLLNGRRVTTHWRYADDLAKRYPGIIVEPDNLYIDDGDILTSAGSSAGIDLCIHLARRDFGAKIANSVARRLVMHAHRQGGQSQYIEQPVPKTHEAHRLSDTLEYIQNSLDQPHTVSSLAKSSGMGSRTFQRRFIALTGIPTIQWINQQRLARACTLLETGSAPLDDVAETVGLTSVENLRYHFRKSLHISPSEYRKRFAEAE